MPGFRRGGRDGSLAAAGPGEVHRQCVERAALRNELYASLRRRIEIFTALPFASLKARLDELAGGRLSVTMAVR